MKRNGRDRMETAAKKMIRGIDYPVDSLFDVPSVHITGNDTVIVEGCKAILSYIDSRITLDMGRFTVSIHGSGIELQNLSKISLAINGKISTIAYDSKGTNPSGETTP